MDGFTDLKAWQKGVGLVKEIYALTKVFPGDERYGLTSQLRRSSTSILANLAEGFGRYTFPDKASRYTIARGESSETKALLFIAIELGFVGKVQAQKAIDGTDEMLRILSGLITSCKRR